MRTRLSDEQGFTLIELLVVILIIGILAAIALPNFLGQRGRGQDAAAKSNARNAVSMVEACYTDTQDYSKCTDTTALGTNTGLDFGTAGSLTAGQVSVSAAAAKPNEYTIVGKSKSANEFSIIKDGNGKITRSCKNTSNAGCPADGVW